MDGMLYASIMHPPVLGSFAEIDRRQGDAGGRRREADGNDRYVQAAGAVSGARRRGGAGGQHLGGDARARKS